MQFYDSSAAECQLEVWETKSKTILGRLLEYLPKLRPGQPMPHVMKENCLKKMKEWQEEAERRGA